MWALVSEKVLRLSMPHQSSFAGRAFIALWCCSDFCRSCCCFFLLFPTIGAKRHMVYLEVLLM